MKTKKKKLDLNPLLQTEIVPIGSLKHWKDNPRVHTKETIKRLTGLIEKHGIRSPLIVWKKNMTVYKGNLTLRALKYLGYDDAPVVFHDFKSEASAVAYALSDNKSSEFAEWDDDVLSKLLQTEQLNLTPEETGYTEKELLDIRRGWDVDFKDIKNIKEDESGLFAVIRIRCPFDRKDRILRRLHKALEDFDNVKVI